MMHSRWEVIFGDNMLLYIYMRFILFKSTYIWREGTSAQDHSQAGSDRSYADYRNENLELLKIPNIV